MSCLWKLELRLHSTSYCLIEVVTKAGFYCIAMYVLIQMKILFQPFLNSLMKIILYLQNCLDLYNNNNSLFHKQIQYA